MAQAADVFHLAALLQSLGRGAAARQIAAAGSASAALARLPEPRADPEILQRQCEAHGIRLLTPEDPAYPDLLRHIPDRPLLLYVRGDPDALQRPAVAVVGARRCTRTGLEVAAALAGALAQRGLCVASGLARGIDTAAHRAALKTGLTVAILGSGLARPYPSGNRGLMDAIERAGGTLVTEYAPWQSARRHHFPERNRLISGVSLGVVVVEAGEHSGSLITARMAAEQGREVCAVPGPVTSPMSRGCHRLIKQGAALVEHADDVLEALGMPSVAPAVPGSSGPGPQGPGDAALARILAAVEGTVTTLDQIVAAAGVGGAVASAALVELELGGFVRQVPGGYIRRLLPSA